MIVTCPSCASRFQYEESRFKGLKSKRFRCPNCGHIFEVNNPTVPIDLSALLGPPPPSQNPTAVFAVPPPSRPPTQAPAPAPPESWEDGEGPSDDPGHSGDTTAKRNRMAMLGEAGLGEHGMPSHHRFSIAFLSGPHASTVKVLDRPRILIGREEGDIVTMDPESSRRHAVIEIHHDGSVWIIDLNSTNGVYVDGSLINGRAQLQDRAEFMCGRSTFMMMIRQEDPYGIL